ncbi:MAG TPA: RidA family protein [Bryobacteraceae bacterium]|nr:RidA family protein [Bryobacteraceae bacterium]
MRLRWLLLLMLAVSAAGAERRVIFPPGTKVVGPYSPGIMAGDFLYVSGQGARRADGQMPASFDEQATQCLENVKTIVEAAGLTMEHVVYTHVYLDNMANFDAMNRVYAHYFAKDPPARATLGVHHLPTDTPIEINAVAVRDLAQKKPIVPSGYKSTAPLSPGVQAGDQLYISGQQGRDPDSGKIPDDPADQVRLAFDRFHQVLAAAGMDYANVVFVNPYLTGKMPAKIMNDIYASHFEFGNTPARATIHVSSLPHDANIEFTGVAVADLSKRRAVRPKNMQPSPTASPCVFAGDTYYCSAKSAFIPGPNLGIYAEDVENQVRMTMRNLLDGLEEAGLNFSNVVASNVYLDNLDEFGKMNGVYAKYFDAQPPTHTTVAPLPPVERKRNANDRWPMIEQISIIAVAP